MYVQVIEELAEFAGREDIDIVEDISSVKSYHNGKEVKAPFHTTSKKLTTG